MPDLEVWVLIFGVAGNSDALLGANFGCRAGLAAVGGKREKALGRKLLEPKLTELPTKP